MPAEDLKESAMMSHLMNALEKGQDIGHYGRLVFVMVGRFFMSNEELVAYLTRDKDCDEEKAAALIRQVEAKGYSPPKRDRVLQWMNEQDFPICENAENPDSCNIYKEVNFPPEVYEKISSYYESQH